MLWLLTAIALLAQPASSDTPSLQRTIPLPGVSGRIDHLAFDPSTKRLFVAALENGSLEVIDLESGERIKSVPGLKEPQGVACVPGQVVVGCGGDGMARAYDAVTLEERQKVKVGDDADNVRMSGTSIIVGYDGGLAVLEAATLRRVGDVKLSGHPESFQVDAGRVFVNIPGGFVGGGGSVAVVSLESREVSATWELKDAGRNFPMALDGKRLYVGCRRPARLLVMDTESGRVVATPECVGDADDIFVDGGRVVVIGGDGAIDVFTTPDQQTYSKAASVKTASGARTGLLVSERRSLYVAVPKRGGRQAEIREYSLPK